MRPLFTAKNVSFALAGLALFLAFHHAMRHDARALCERDPTVRAGVCAQAND